MYIGVCILLTQLLGLSTCCNCIWLETSSQQDGPYSTLAEKKSMNFIMNKDSSKKIKDKVVEMSREDIDTDLQFRQAVQVSVSSLNIDSKMSCVYFSLVRIDSASKTKKFPNWLRYNWSMIMRTTPSREKAECSVKCAAEGGCLDQYPVTAEAHVRPKLVIKVDKVDVQKLK